MRGSKGTNTTPRDRPRKVFSTYIYRSKYLLIIPTYLPTYLSIYLPTNNIYLPTYLLITSIYLHTYLRINLSIYQ